MKQAHAPSGIPIAVPTLRDQHRHLSSKALRSLMPSLADREAVERLGGGDRDMLAWLLDDKKGGG